MPVAGNNGGGGGSANDVRAGGAFIEVSARDKLSAQLAALKTKVMAFAASLSQIGKVTTFAGLAGLAPLTALFKTGLGRAEDIAKGAEELGFTVEQYQRIKYAADAAGVSVEDVLRKQEKYVGLMAAAPVLDSATIKESVEAQQRLRMAFIDLQTAITPLISTLIPVVRAFSRFVKENADAVRVFAVGAAGLVALGVAAFTLGKAIGVVVGTITLVGKGLGLLVTVVGKLLGGLSLVWGVLTSVWAVLKTLWLVGVAGFTALFSSVGALVGVFALLLAGLKGWSDLAGGLGKTFVGVGQTFHAMFKGIIDAIKQGDFDRAFKIFAAGIEAVWYDMLLGMARAFSEFIEKNRDRLIALGALLGGVKGAGLGGRIGARFGPWGALIGGGIGGGLGALGGGLGADQLGKLIEGIANNNNFAAAGADARRRMQEAMAAGAPAVTGGDAMSRQITATRSAFRILGDATQQFGRSNIQSEQLQQLKMLAADGKLQVQELKQLNQYIKDLMRFK